MAPTLFAGVPTQGARRGDQPLWLQQRGSQPGQGQARGGAVQVETPFVTHSLKPPGFTTLERYEVKTRFFLKICFLKCNLYRYIEAYRAESEPLQAEVNAAKSRAAKASKSAQSKMDVESSTDAVLAPGIAT